MPEIVIHVPEKELAAILGKSLIPTSKSRLRWMCLGFAIQAVFVTALAVIPLLFPSAIHFLPRYWVTSIEVPVTQPWKPQPKQPHTRAPITPTVVAKEVVGAQLATPKPPIISPVLSSPAKKPVSDRTASAPDAPEVTQDSATNIPTVGSSAIPTLRKPREEVQTGGFGDPDGVPANGKKSSAPNITQLGSYENPIGPGNGNGIGGAKGVDGTTVSSGFGNGTASSRSARRGGSVQQGMFADGIATTSTPKMKPVVATAPRTRSVQVLFKPKPKYTDEARAKKIEGDVSLEVLFRASGEVEVQRVISGLGYGLDESAQAAAREIRFQPALRDGEPVDFSAIVHITFALAY